MMRLGVRRSPRFFFLWWFVRGRDDTWDWDGHLDNSAGSKVWRVFAGWQTVRARRLSHVLGSNLGFSNLKRRVGLFKYPSTYLLLSHTWAIGKLPWNAYSIPSLKCITTWLI